MAPGIKEKIIKFINTKKEASIADLVGLTGFSRAYVNRILREVINQKKIMRLGRTNQVRYIAYTEEAFRLEGLVWRKQLQNKDLNEDEVFKDIKYNSDFFKDIPEQTVNILEYAFTEMLNNAIDHSGSRQIIVEFKKAENAIEFVVDDFGVGIFNKIMRSRHLKNEHEAIQDLLKGKQTTAREFHSGEGIFFTSKAADVFSLASEKTELIIENIINDIFVRPHRHKRGTKVFFKININTNKKLANIFAHFAGVEHGFTKTEIKVKLYTLDTSFISRSQARRLLAGLNEFKEIVLDFDRVEMVGQGFVDEIFRAYQNSHPDKKITYINTNSEVEFMIKRALV
ncbi:MAG: regulatory protein ArsR [Parcubacteria group bacterium Gr01-1014_13]|nr:MAG: regulatory protein ArsR [Parcubacteria group bacterium Gr01-1014_13]